MGRSERRQVRCVYLGRTEDDKLLYAGKAEHGFSGDDARDLVKQLKPLVQTAQPYSVKVSKPKAVWLKPKLLAEIEYRAQTESGKLRHPSFEGLRGELD